jgi:flagellar hook-associated protein 3 FlgL
LVSSALANGYPIAITQNRLQTQITVVKTQLDDARYAAVTGKHADSQRQLGGRTGEALRLEKDRSDLAIRLEQITLVKSDFSFAQTTLSQISESAGGYPARILVAVNGNEETAIAALALEADAELKIAFSALNTRFAGKQLFSGAATDTPPLGPATDFLQDVQDIIDANTTLSDIETALDTYFADGGGFDDIYNGSTANGPQREISSTHRAGITYRADDDALKQIFRGYAMFIAGQNIAGDAPLKKDVQKAAAEYLQSGTDDLIIAQAQMGAEEAVVDASEARMTAEKKTLDAVYFQIAFVDQYEAVTRMNNLEAQLQSIYLTTARIQNLSLVNFLR